MSGGGTASNASGYIGYDIGSTGEVTVIGAGSSWNSGNWLYIGFKGNGMLTVADGGELSVNGGNGVVSIAQDAGSTGVLNIGGAVGRLAQKAGSVAASELRFGAGNGSLNFNHTEAAYTFAAKITGDGRLNQVAGTTILTGANSYSGATTISGGTLMVDGSISGTGAVAVDNGATLGGKGSLAGAVTVASGGILQGKSGQTLTTGALVLDNGAKVNVALGTTGQPALFQVNGDLTLDGTLNVSDTGGFGAGVYRLFNYSGALGNKGLEIGSRPTGADLSVQITAVDRQVNLVNTGGQILYFWDGDEASKFDNGQVDGGNGTWSASASAGNWTNQDGAVNGPMASTPGFAVFQGEAGTVMADASAGALAVTGMQFASAGYRLKGAAITLSSSSGAKPIIRVGDGSGTHYTATIDSVLTGSSGLEKTDVGTLILTGANNYSGGTIVSGGVLQGNSTSLPGNITNNAKVVFDQSTDDIYGGDMVGIGALEKTGAGRLTLTGANSYSGGTIVSDGVLQGNSTSLQGNITNNAKVVFEQAAATQGSYAGAMGGSGALEKTGTGRLTLSGANSYSGGTTIAAGTLVGNSSSFGSGAINIKQQGTLQIAQDSDSTLANDLAGSGTLSKTGAGALRLTGDGSGFTGSMQIHAGSLSANGRLGGTLEVGSGASLKGSGEVGSAHLLDGAVLAPGNSIGTLKVAGDLTFDSGARYEVEAQADGQSDLVQVSGKATLGSAAVVMLAANGRWNPLTRYTILRADGGLVGNFGTVSSNFAFLTPSLDYSAHEVGLTLQRNATGFAEIGETANQRATGAAAQALPEGALYNALVQLDAPTARSAFDQLSGEIHASLRSALVEDSRLVRDAASDRLRLAQGGVAVNGAQLAQSADGAAAWTRAYGAWGNSDSDGNAAQMDRSVRGVLIGGDQRFGNWRLGAFAGGGRSKVDARNSSATVDSVHLGLYGGTQWGALGLRTGLAYSRHNIDTARQVAFTGLAESARAAYTAQTSQLFGELGWQLGAGATALEPFANLAYVSLKTDGFEERGGISALTASSQRSGNAMATLGVRASTQWSVGNTPVSARGLLGWRHALGDVTSSASMAFAGGGSFAVGGLPLAKNVALLELGLDMALQRDLTLGVAYSGQIGSDLREQAVKVNLLWKF